MASVAVEFSEKEPKLDDSEEQRNATDNNEDAGIIPRVTQVLLQEKIANISLWNVHVSHPLLWKSFGEIFPRPSRFLHLKTAYDQAT